jgi:tol-pal system protein YbgF
MRLPLAFAVLAAGTFGAYPLLAQQPGSGFRTSAVGDAASGLTARVEKLEEQMVDLQGTVAGVETLAKSGGGSSAASGIGASSGGGADTRQLAAQIAELNQRLERLEARMGAGGAAGGARSQAPAVAAVAPAPGFQERDPLPPVGGRGSQAGTGDTATGTGTDPRPSSRQAAVDPAPRVTSSAPSSSDAQALFEQASSAFGRKEYSAAETYFNQFMQQYPNDAKAGLAQFWLGETAFASGEYRAAADRFLKAFNNYQTSEKAPEALLKLAISLRRIGENTAACESFSELQKRFPQAPKAVTQRAETEKRRANCT